MGQTEQIDGAIRDGLRQLTASRPSYWSYNGNARRAASFDYFQYPAMMVPEMLRDLIRTIVEADGNIKNVLDPFAGSGSVLTEAMFQGLAFSGTDVNPLAVLLCKMKAGPFLESAELESRIEDLLYSVESDPSPTVEANFRNINKWFHRKAIRELSTIRRAIRSERNLWCRRFFWVALAETIRLCSNTRTSTYKLHIRDRADLEARKEQSPINVFEEVLNENFLTLVEQTHFLEVSGLLRRRRYARNVGVQLSDARHHPRTVDEFDLLITSPPYGDNATTVPYGQHSYLPLQWIDFKDIDRNADPKCLETTHGIDTRSLGGLKSSALNNAAELNVKSPSLAAVLANLANQPSDRGIRVAAFARDLYSCIGPVLMQLRKGAYMIWVIGNRRVGGLEIPTSRILQEFLEGHNATHVITLDRVIPSKRMANKNSVTKTMSKEKILIFRNG
jgi:hypothetical protein